MDYNNYYLRQAGGQLSFSVYRGQPFQRGSGLGGVFKRFFRWIVPIVKQHALPALESGARFVGNQVLKSSKDLTNDVLDGQDLKDSAESRMNEVVGAMKARIEDKLAGRGLKRKASSSIKGGPRAKNFIILKKKTTPKSRSLDIFD